MVTIAGCSNNACENRLGVIWLHGCSNYLTFPRLVSLTAWHIQMILLFGLVVVQCIHSQWVEINYEGEFLFSCFSTQDIGEKVICTMHSINNGKPQISNNTVLLLRSIQVLTSLNKASYFHATMFSWVIPSNFHYKQNPLSMVSVQPEFQPVSCL